MKRGLKYYSKKLHRYLGVFIGIQFFFWTLGGLYFSWTNITEIRGEHLREHGHELPLSANLVSPDAAFAEIKKTEEIAKPHKIQLIEILQKPFYEIVFETGDGKMKTVLADASNGILRGEIGKDEAQTIAFNALKEKSVVTETVYLTEQNVGGHHEYREKPLPVYAVSFKKPSGLTVYVSAQTGRVESFRTDQWRVFDFFWMLHTLDFYGRDDINNYVLRAFSVLGLLTIFSGFLLFFQTSPLFGRKKAKNL